MSLPKLLTTRDAAAALGVGVRCLDAWRNRGLGPRYCKLGRLVRYSVDDLEAFLVDATRGPGARPKATSSIEATDAVDGLLKSTQRKEPA